MTKATTNIITALRGMLRRRSARGVGIALFAMLSAASFGTTLLAWSQPQQNPPHGVLECGQCHGRLNPSAALYVAVNGTPINPGQAIAMAPGDSFEIDFHFQNMLGDPQRFQGVGAEIVVPGSPPWRLFPGSPKHPNDWSASGSGATLWSANWDRGAAGAGTPTNWVETLDRRGAFYLSLTGVPSSTVSVPVVFDERGAAPADKDGVADHFGADAVVGISSGTPPGKYEVSVRGIGHSKGGGGIFGIDFDRSNGRSMVSLSFSVEIGPRVVASPTPKPKTGLQIFARGCRGCHGTVPNRVFLAGIAGKAPDALAQSIAAGVGDMPAQSDANGGRLTAADITAVVEYLKKQASLVARSGPRGVPVITHTVQGRLLCLVCHDTDGIKPKPSSHGGYVSDAYCNVCHTAPYGGAPLIPHKVQGRAACLQCHAKDNSAGITPVTPEHQDRTNQTCMTCHFDRPLDVAFGTPTPVRTPSPRPTVTGYQPIPGIQHTLKGRSSCLTCHDLKTGIFPMPATHIGRSQQTCQGCHKPARPTMPATPTIPAGPPRVIAPLVPHDLDGRGACTSCHRDGAGVIPMPADSHVGRDDLSCLGCHRPGVGPGAASDAEPTAVPSEPGAGDTAPRPEPTATPAPSNVLAPPVPHTVAGFEACTACHQETGGDNPMPGSHAGRTDLSCFGCHRPTSNPDNSASPAASDAAPSTPSDAGGAAAPSATPGP